MLRSVHNALHSCMPNLLLDWLRSSRDGKFAVNPRDKPNALCKLRVSVIFHAWGEAASSPSANAHEASACRALFADTRSLRRLRMTVCFFCARASFTHSQPQRGHACSHIRHNPFLQLHVSMAFNSNAPTTYYAKVSPLAAACH